MATVPTTWDAATATNTALTDDDLTATHINATTNSGVRSTAYKTSGKFYFEITTGATVASADTIGLLISSGTYTNYVTSKSNCMACSAGSGNIYSTNVNTGKNITTLITGGPHVVGIAVDLDARLGWFRKNAGNWNGDVAANPATGAGGVALPSSVSFSPAVGYNALNSSWIANFGATAFANAAPAEFTGGWIVEGPDVLPPQPQPSPGGSGYPGAWSSPRRKKRKRDEIEELLELIAQPAQQISQIPQIPQIPPPPAPALIDLAPKLQAAGLSPPQRKIVKRAIVTDDEDDDEEAIELLLNLLS